MRSHVRGRQTGQAGGFSLLEVLLATALLAAIAVPAALAMESAMRSWRNQKSRMDLVQVSGMAFQRLSSEIRYASVVYDAGHVQAPASGVLEFGAKFNGVVADTDGVDDGFMRLKYEFDSAGPSPDLLLRHVYNEVTGAYDLPAQTAAHSVTAFEPRGPGSGGTDANTIALYHLNEASGSTEASDATGNGHDGALNGMDPITSWVAGYWDGALQSTGGEYLQVEDHPALNPPEITIECWYFSADPSENHRLMQKKPTTGSPGFILRNLGTGKFEFGMRTDLENISWAPGSTVAAPNTWYHVAATYDGSAIKISVNGVEEGSDLKLGSMANTGILKIGGHSSGGQSTPFILDEIRISRVVRYTSNFTPPTEEFGGAGDNLVRIRLETSDGTRSTELETSIRPRNLK